MSEAITFEANTGTLLAPRDVLYELLEGEGEGDGEGLGLEAAGGLPGGRLHPALGAARRAAGEPLCRMRLERGDREGAAWVVPDVAALVVPRRDGRWQLSTLPVLYLPDALARLNDVGPRPRVRPAVALSLEPGRLATAIATRSVAGSGLVGDPAEALQTALGSLREHWRIESAWHPSPGSTGVRVLEVLDSAAGMWQIVPTDPTVELWTTTPTLVFRQLAAMLPRDHELAGAAA